MMRLAFVLTILTTPLAIASEHPGNIFLVGDEVQVDIPETWTAWRAIDISNQEVAAGEPGDGKAQLGKLPIGYFEIREKDGPGMITAAVVAKSQPVENTPIAIDTAISWFYATPQQVNEQQIRDVCKLARLAGVNWVRDRLSWPEIEPARGTWADETRYEKAMAIEHDEGLKILQVNHISPPWASANPTRFPEDLRDVFNFYRGLAKRYKDLADAIEPWNEPDIEIFGGHTGCEIASFHKAAYLGLKAGDPDKPVCGTVFALDRAETLDEFGANDVAPYFQRYTLHHYIGLPAYPRAYGRHRAVSGGRPMWVTEFNLPVAVADPATQEPSDEDLRKQAYRVSKTFCGSLNEGAELAFYFILGHYEERGFQFGLVRHNLTPRPAYVAFAAVGRFLNGAKPLGRVDYGDDKLRAFVFQTKVDGKDRETLVAWSETKPTNVATAPAEKLYDYLGRELPLRKDIQLTAAPVFMILPPGGAETLTIEPPPKKPEWQEGETCPVVLQLIGEPDFRRSVFVLDESKKLQLVAYNFSEKPVSGILSLDGADGAPSELQLAAGERKEFAIQVRDANQVTARLESNEGRHAIVSAAVTTTPPEESNR